MFLLLPHFAGNQICRTGASLLLAIAVNCCLWISGAIASEISFDDLPDPEAQTFSDPFKALSEDQLDGLRRVVRYQSELEASDLKGTARSNLKNRLNRVLNRLTTAGVDPEGLLAQRWAVAKNRRNAATAGNPDLDGRPVSISGFVIPAPDDGSSVLTAYLVPERGMCSHTPPPPPNQLLRLAVGNGWSPKSVYEPVRVTGRLAIDPKKRRFNVVDGQTDMVSTFRMDVTHVEPLLPFATSARTPVWPVKPGGTYTPTTRQ